MKILFLSKYPLQNASFRYRVHQFLPYLEEEGIEWDVHFLIDEQLYYILYLGRKSNYLFVLFLLVKSIFCRLFYILRAGRYDVVFVQREQLPRIKWLEWLLYRCNRRIIFDIDDGVFFRSGYRKHFPFYFRISREVIVGNRFLAEEASPHCQRVTVIPTVVNLDEYQMISREKNSFPLQLGWLGSHTNQKHLEELRPVLEDLWKNHSFELRVVANFSLNWDRREVVNIPWTLETYLDELGHFDIGLMPLEEGEWEKYKCGFKLIQYMARGIPSVASPVGVNSEIIEHGKSGFLASTPGEWHKYLARLIEEKELRDKMGQAGRERIRHHYSLSHFAPLWKQIILRTNQGGAAGK